jgi:hypothetical protein
VVLELATAVVLLVGAGLLGQSFYRLLNVDLGFLPDRLATLRVGAPASYSEDAQIVLLGRRILSSVASLPGVESAALTSTLPVQGGNTVWIRIVGQPYHGEHNEVKFRSVMQALQYSARGSCAAVTSRKERCVETPCHCRPGRE